MTTTATTTTNATTTATITPIWTGIVESEPDTPTNIVHITVRTWSW